MALDQRNAGASVTASDGYVTVDRYYYFGSQASKFTIGQNLGSVTPPAGFRNYLGLSVSATATVGSSDYFFIGQKIEGFNVADFNLGTASAVTFTLSFWVRSSLTGTFGGSLRNGAQNRSYPFTYTISSANTWEQKSVTVAGDTSGTWLTTNGSGLELSLSLGTGSSLSGTAGAWTGSSLLSATGATSVVGTSGATFYITGVQLEVGTQATSFEYRQYQQELALCQRYYVNNFINALGSYHSTSIGFINVPLPVYMRAAPTVSLSSGSALNIDVPAVFATTFNTPGFGGITVRQFRIGGTLANSGTIGMNIILTDNTVQASAEL
jgi:hypothetical protein